MASYEDFLDDLRPSLSEAPDPMITKIARRIVIEFCKRSRIYKTPEKITIPLVSQQEVYEVPVPNQTVLSQITDARVIDDNGANWKLIDRKNSENRLPEIRRFGIPDYFSHPFNENTIAIYPVPDIVQSNMAIELYGVLIPAETSTSFPDEIRDEWYDGILDGIRYRLMIQPNKPWSDKDLAVFHMNEYYKTISDARSKGNSDGWGPRHTHIPRYW